MKACRPPTVAGRARRVKPPIPNQDDRYHPLACMPALPLREVYDERSRVFPHPPTCRRQQPRRVTAMRAYSPCHIIHPAWSSRHLVPCRATSSSNTIARSSQHLVPRRSASPSSRFKHAIVSSSQSPSAPHISQYPAHTMPKPRHLQRLARQAQTTRTPWPCCQSSTAWTPPSTPGWAGRPAG